VEQWKVGMGKDGMMEGWNIGSSDKRLAPLSALRKALELPSTRWPKHC